jgi:hypothetical protein
MEATIWPGDGIIADPMNRLPIGEDPRSVASLACFGARVLSAAAEKSYALGRAPFAKGGAPRPRERVNLGRREDREEQCVGMGEREIITMLCLGNTSPLASVLD